MSYLAATLALPAFIFACHVPVIPAVRVLMLPVPDKGRILLCFLDAWLRNLLTFIPDMLAPVVVPIALVFTRWDAEHLPWLFRWWDNDASINGDRRTDDPNDGLGGWALKPVPLARDSADAISMAYYAPGHHPRSFYARYVWIGLRNRASALSQVLGTDADGPATQWAGENWTLDKVGTAYRYYEMLPLGPVAIRMHCGFKVPRIPGESKAPAVSIGFSLRRRRD